jgi:hypothetical protein
MTDEQIPQIPEVEPEPFQVSAELQAAVDAALGIIRQRSFSERHPELGKMVNCQICKMRHRVNERKCEQKFTYRVGDYELFREEVNEETGEIHLVPAYRTAVQPGERPRLKQIVGAAQFVKKRFHPHHSKVKLQFIQRTRIVFERLGFITDTDKETFEKNLQRARVVAARELRKERELSDRAYRRRRDQARRTNRGLKLGRNRA